MNITKKTAFGATAAAAAIAVIGVTTPAMASEGHYSTSTSKWYSSTSTQHTDTVVAPDVNVLNGDILNGNSVASGNESAIGSGNDTAIGNGSGNGNLSGNSASDLVDNSTGTSVGDLVDVGDVLGDIGGWVNLSGMFQN